MPPINVLVMGAGSRGANHAGYAHWHPARAQAVGSRWQGGWWGNKLR